MAGPDPDAAALIELPVPTQLRATLGVFGSGDPSWRMGPGVVWRALRTPEGPATVRLVPADGAAVGRGLCCAVEARAWGPGAAWALARTPDLLGASDRGAVDPVGHPVVARLARLHPGLRLGRSGGVVATLVPTILAQRVTSIEARRAYRALVRVYGDPAPDPGGAVGLRLGPDPARLAAVAYHDLHRFGIERTRAETIRRVCRRADRLDAEAPAEAVLAVLETLPGVGPWTRATVALFAFGDPDAVIVGDYHLPNIVSWNLAGEPRADDDRMLELLEPFRPQRGRVMRLLTLGGRHAPKFGPRQRIRDISRM